MYKHYYNYLGVLDYRLLIKVSKMYVNINKTISVLIIALLTHVLQCVLLIYKIIWGTC